MDFKAAFVGLATWDLIYLVDHLPTEDEKVVALDAAMNAGGPATNASVTFAHLGGEALLVSAVGFGCIGSAILEDLGSHKVALHDIAPIEEFQPPISSAFLKKGGASRALVSLNGSKIAGISAWSPDEVLDGCSLILVDGHYMDAAMSAARWGATAGIPVVLDAGSWKAGTDELLTLCDVVIASSRFAPPGCSSALQTLDYLAAAGIARMAVTDGAHPILFREGGATGSVATFQSKGIDTTGAGDVLHGAFCHFILSGFSFTESLSKASRIAACKCDHLGARSWLKAREALMGKGL